MRTGGSTDLRLKPRPVLEPRRSLKPRHSGLANKSLASSSSHHTSQITLQKSAARSNFHFSTPQETHTWKTRTSSFSLLAKKEPQTWPQCIQIEPTPRLG